MINFHKFGFLDVRKMTKLLEESNYWLSRYNPVWLFIWSDLYKPEISFQNDACYIRYLMPGIGMCYYPPIGAKNLKEAMKKIEEDCFENGFDLNLGPADQDMYFDLTKLGYKLYENNELNSYVYLTDDLTYFKNSKAKKNVIAKFEKANKDVFYKKIKKEDFPEILEFINKWQEALIKQDIKDSSYFSKLNMIKKCMDHLYEFDMLAIMIRDEDKLYGIAIGSQINNTISLHTIITLPDIVGSYEVTLSCFAKLAYNYARYINLEECYNNKSIEDLDAYKIEKFYSSFGL
ncbi:MAG: DUF2156 domain-containing protein [Acholeplasmatales bacterium]|nr:DUF2156 domain-containing protein [Acholeplasmatales bacterium]